MVCFIETSSIAAFEVFHGLDSLKLKTPSNQIKIQEAGPARSWVRGSASLRLVFYQFPQFGLGLAAGDKLLRQFHAIPHATRPAHDE